MNITIIQVLAIVFFTFALSRALLRARDRKISLAELIFWCTVWGGLIFVVFFPTFVTRVANAVGIGRGVDIIIYGSIALMFYMIFRLYVRLEETERELTRVIREIAISNRKKR
jgi:hypothetical protein